MIKIAVCDDERIFRDEISRILKTYSQEMNAKLEVECFVSGEALLQSTVEYDLYFLDYYMTGINGMDTAWLLRNRGIKAQIVFLTYHKEAMQEAFKVKAFRYLIKDSNKEELYHCIDDFINDCCSYEKIKVNGIEGYMIINSKNIQYITASHNGSEVWTEDGSYHSCYSLNEWELRLDRRSFFRSHKNSIVNLGFINKVDSIIELTSGERVELSRRSKLKLQSAMVNYISKYA
jgi:two-component system LytT family response regulator